MPKCSSTHKIKFANIFSDKMRRAFALQKLLTFFLEKYGSVSAYKLFEILMSCLLMALLVLKDRAQMSNLSSSYHRF